MTQVTRNCYACGKSITRKAAHMNKKRVFCNRKCLLEWQARKENHPIWMAPYYVGDARVGEKNPNWKGDAAGPDAGRYRARKYKLKPCEVCGDDDTERHHKDSNPLNNKADNIAFLCRKHHMEADGRLGKLIENNKIRHAH